MKKGILLLCFFLVMSLSACQKNESGSAEDEGSSGEKVSAQSETEKSSSQKKEEGGGSTLDSKANATVYYGTKDHFEEYPVTVDQEQQRKEIIKFFIDEIGKHAGYEIETTEAREGNRRLYVTFAEGFNPPEETATAIYDSIYKTCREALGVSSAYYTLPDGEQVTRTLDD